MTLSFAETLDRGALLRACDAVVEIVGSPEVEAAWASGSALPGMTVGGLVRHLVSQPECAVEFLTSPPPPDRPPVALLASFDRADWLDAPVDAPENTSICADFNAMAAGGPADSRAILDRARAALPAAVAAAGPTTYVPWQDCSLHLDDFLVCRLLEVVVHADDLAASLGVAGPVFDADVCEPVVSLLAALSVRRHGPTSVLRALARTERASGSVSAFG